MCIVLLVFLRLFQNGKVNKANVLLVGENGTMLGIAMKFEPAVVRIVASCHLIPVDLAARIPKI
jgi:hypothetical protein